MPTTIGSRWALSPGSAEARQADARRRRPPGLGEHPHRRRASRRWTIIQDDGAFSYRVGAIYQFDNGIAPYAELCNLVPAHGRHRREWRTVQAREPASSTRPECNSAARLECLRHACSLRSHAAEPPNPGHPENIKPKETGEVRSRGIEVEGVASFPSGSTSSPPTRFLDAEITVGDPRSKATCLTAFRDHRASFWADYTVPDGRYEASAAVSACAMSAKSFGNDENTFEVPGYSILDAALHYDSGRFGLRLNASNVFDTKYVSSCFVDGGRMLLRRAPRSHRQAHLSLVRMARSVLRPHASLRRPGDRRLSVHVGPDGGGDLLGSRA